MFFHLNWAGKTPSRPKRKAPSRQPSAPLNTASNNGTSAVVVGDGKPKSPIDRLAPRKPRSRTLPGQNFNRNSLEGVEIMSLQERMAMLRAKASGNP